MTTANISSFCSSTTKCVANFTADRIQWKLDAFDDLEERTTTDELEKAMDEDMN